MNIIPLYIKVQLYSFSLLLFHSFNPIYEPSAMQDHWGSKLNQSGAGMASKEANYDFLEPTDHHDIAEKEANDFTFKYDLTQYDDDDEVT